MLIILNQYGIRLELLVGTLVVLINLVKFTYLLRRFTVNTEQGHFYKIKNHRVWIISLITLLVIIQLGIGMTTGGVSALYDEGDGLDRNWSIVCGMFVVVIGSFLIFYKEHELKEHINQEYSLILLISWFGLIYCVRSTDRIIRYRLLELSSLCMYYIACYRTHSTYSTEASLKYYLIGSRGSGFRLYGLSYRYLTYGTLHLLEMHILNHSSSNYFESMLSSLGIVLTLSGVLVKLGVVPMHLWLADVYDGAPILSAIYFAVIPKRPRCRVLYSITDMLLSLDTNSRVVPIQELSSNTAVYDILWVVSASSIIVGSIGALRQRRWKRFLAYSAVTHTGNILCIVRNNTIDGNQAIILYGLSYMAISLVIWGMLSSIEIVYRNTETYKKSFEYRVQLSGVTIQHGYASMVIIMTRMSMGGVPPLMGFITKMLVGINLLENGYLILISVLMISSVIGCYNYLRITKVILFEKINEGAIDYMLIMHISKENALIHSILLSVIMFCIRNPTSILILSHYASIY